MPSANSKIKKREPTYGWPLWFWTMLTHIPSPNWVRGQKAHETHKSESQVSSWLRQVDPHPNWVSGQKAYGTCKCIRVTSEFMTKSLSEVSLTLRGFLRGGSVLHRQFLMVSHMQTWHHEAGKTNFSLKYLNQGVESNKSCIALWKTCVPLWDAHKNLISTTITKQWGDHKRGKCVF